MCDQFMKLERDSDRLILKGNFPCAMDELPPNSRPEKDDLGESCLVQVLPFCEII